MKNTPMYLALAAGLMVAACSSEVPAEDVDRDSVRAEDSVVKAHTLESLLDLGSEADLRKQYGENAVKYDTIWGAEGFFSMGTVLRIDTVSKVEIYWMNDSLRTGLVSVTLVSESDWYGDSIPAGTWKSSTGVEQVEKINGQVFTFSGFGWDYAGGLISWENGALDGKGISVQMAEGTGYDSLPQKDYLAILGDVPVSSSDVTARKSGARVWSVSVAKVR